MTSATDASAGEGAAFLAGKLLIASPSIGDPRFERAVILVCAHTADHAMGVALNHPIPDIDFAALLERLKVKGEVPAPEAKILLGGPVESERGFVLHTDDYESPNVSVAVAPGLSLTATREVLEAVVSRDRSPRRWTLALGYAGWGPGQLEREFRDNAWLACDADESLIFGSDHARKWELALRKIGVSPDHLSAEGGVA